MLYAIKGTSPVCAPTAVVADSAHVIGDVRLGGEVSVWYGAVLRGNCAAIRVDDGSNVQDNAVVHTDPGHPAHIGKNVTVGHGAILHGCTIEDGCLIGMGAIVMNGCVVGAGSLVGAGALVPQNKLIPPGSLVMGVPAKVVRPLTEEELAENLLSAEDYRTTFRPQLAACKEM